jgi:cell division protein ZapA (FtsZ GTPase activity inhibitor)
MNLSEHQINDTFSDSDTSESIKKPETNLDSVLYNGDVGELKLETRRTLVQLLSGPSLDERRHSRLWPILLRDEAVIRRRLADLFLELVIDRDLQVAFTRQADTGDLKVPVLLRRAQLSFIDSVLLLYLRQCLIQADARGERAVISVNEMVEHLTLYKQTLSTDHAGFTKRILASIEKIKKHNILQKIRASDNRFEISPTLKLLFSAEEIQSLSKLYRQKLDSTDQQSQEVNNNVDD